MEIFNQIFSIALLGFIGGANPGPLLTAALTEALRGGFLKSLRVVLMAMISEIIVAVLVLFLFFSFNIPQAVFYAISFVGAVFLLWLALQIWKIKKIDGEGEIFSFKKIFFLTVFNGPFWIFWVTICVPQAFLLKEAVAGGELLFLISFELGWLLSTVSLVFLFSRFRLFLSKSNFISAVFKLFSIILLFFSAKMILQSLVFFFKII